MTTNSHTLIIPDALIPAALSGRITNWVSPVPEEWQDRLTDEMRMRHRGRRYTWQDYTVLHSIPSIVPLGVPGNEIRLYDRRGCYEESASGVIRSLKEPIATLRNTGVEVKQACNITDAEYAAMGLEYCTEMGHDDCVFNGLGWQCALAAIYPDLNLSTDPWMFVTSMEGMK